MFADEGLVALRELRNDALKLGIRRAGEEIKIRTDAGPVVTSHVVSITVAGPGGKQRDIPSYVRVPAEAEVVHRFTSGRWQGQPVLVVMEQTLQRFETSIIRQAQLFAKEADH